MKKIIIDAEKIKCRKHKKKKSYYVGIETI